MTPESWPESFYFAHKRWYRLRWRLRYWWRRLRGPLPAAKLLP
jgi:hypothetical protein